MAIKHKESVNSDVKTVHVSHLHSQKLEKSDNQMNIFAIGGVNFDAQQLVSLLSTHFEAHVSFNSYEGVLIEDGVEFKNTDNEKLNRIMKFVLGGWFMLVISLVIIYLIGTIVVLKQEAKENTEWIDQMELRVSRVQEVADYTQGQCFDILYGS